MQASIYFVLLLRLAGCSDAPSSSPPRPQAVRVVEPRHGAVVQGIDALAEVIAERTVRLIAQVPGTVAALEPAEGERVTEATPIVRLAAPDVAARVARAQAERDRAERERAFACELAGDDRALAAAGDVPELQMERSEKSCASATFAAKAAAAAAREAAVAGSRAVERAPFDGEVLHYLVDPGQTVMPGTPLAQFGSANRQLRIRLPERDLERIDVGTAVLTPHGRGRVARVGATAIGPGRLVELRVDLENPIDHRPGTTLVATLVVDAWDDATAVPIAAIREDQAGPYIFTVRDGRLNRVDVELGPVERGWVAIQPELDPSALVVADSAIKLDPSRPVLAVKP